MVEIGVGLGEDPVMGGGREGFLGARTKSESPKSDFVRNAIDELI